MIGANRMKMHQSIALLRLSPNIDDIWYRPAMVFKLYESYSLEHIYNPVGTLYLELSDVENGSSE